MGLRVELSFHTVWGSDEEDPELRPNCTKAVMFTKEEWLLIKEE
jgi:hypothetical protein